MSRLSQPRLAEPPLLFRILWGLLWPIRLYVRHASSRRGTARLARRLLDPLLPTLPAGFIADLPGGGRAALFYREAIGRSIFLFGGFETVEMRHFARYARRATVAVDAGANVGIFTIPLATAVGEDGLVLAFEPDPANVRRLSANIARSGLSNVEVVQAAAGESEGTIELRLASDPAFHSTVDAPPADSADESLFVRQTQIDSIWQQRGHPLVSAVKIDIEGAEIHALRGCERVLATCRPALLIEAATNDQFGCVAEWLSGRNYSPSQPKGFAPWNFLFLPTAAPAASIDESPHPNEATSVSE